MYNIFLISEYIIVYSNKKQYFISNLKLQKILYFIQAEFLVNFSIPCFNNTIKAWDFGPVIPEVYFKYLVYGAASIIDIKNKNKNFSLLINENHIEIINDIIEYVKNYDASELTRITMNQTPWKTAYYKKNREITKKSIKDFFK